MTDRPYEGSPGSPYDNPYSGYDPYAGQYPQQPAAQQPYPQAQPQAPAAQQPYPQQPYPQAPAAQQPYPHAQPQAPAAQQAHPHGESQAWPGQQQAYGDPHAAEPYTQQWQGQTWDSQTHVRPPAVAAETAYLPPVGHQGPVAAHGVQGAGVQGGGGHGGQAPSYASQSQQQQPQAPAPSAAAETAYLPPVGQHAPQPQAAAPAAAATAADPAGDGPDYGPATVAGNARVTDAQRARAEGRSPIIEPGMQPAALTALLGLLLAGAAELGVYGLLLPLVVLQGVTAAGWFRLNGMWPARQGIALGFAGALAADVVVLAAGREHAPAAILGTLGVWVLLSLVLQLRSHADPDERMYGLMATVAAAALAIVATGYLAAPPDAVAVGAVAVAVAVLARALPLPTPASVAVALLAAAVAGVAVGGMTDLGAKGALLGAGAAVCALVGHRAASYDYPSRFVHFTAGVALPLSAAAPAVWVLGRALG
ncbi:hypothetical protein ACIHCX_30950 [Streptomyces sp. NPDC052043]|uniref:hypothetical protein n=1 Tax=Streptomyces sp. NPDC052043 TaxID=3365684 RepID=UPI0037CE8203